LYAIYHNKLTQRREEADICLEKRKGEELARMKGERKGHSKQPGGTVQVAKVMEVF